MKTVILDDWENYIVNHSALSHLKSFSEVEIYNDKPDFENLVSRLKEADAIILIRERTKITKDLIEKLPKLKFIAQTGKGIKHLDEKSISNAQIPIAISPGGSKVAVTELTLTFLLSLFKRVHELDLKVKDNHWPEVIGTNLEGKTLGVIGLGQIGTSVANAAKGLGMKVIAWGPTLTEERASREGVQFVTQTELLKYSDAISLHVRLVPETYHLLKKEHFELMKKNAFIINTSRGAIIDENALINALQNELIAGAGLDVFEEEPLNDDNPLKKLPNTILTPHVGWKTNHTFNKFIEDSIENIENFFYKKDFNNIINIDKITIK